MDFRAFGKVIVYESGLPVPNLMVSLFDHDPQQDLDALRRLSSDIGSASAGEVLGTALTDDKGRFELRFSTDDFQDDNEQRPDLLVAVFAPLTSGPSGTSPLPPSKRLLHFSMYPWMRAGREEGFVIRIRQEQLDQHHILVGTDQPIDSQPISIDRPPLGDVLRNAISKGDERRAAVTSVSGELIAPRVLSAVEDGNAARRVALSFSTVDRTFRDDPFVIADNASSAERRERIYGAELVAAETGLDLLSDATRDALVVRLDPEILVDHLPPGVSIDDLPTTVTVDVTCGLLHAAAGGYSLRRTRTLRDASARLRQLRGDAGGETVDDVGGDDGGEGEVVDGGGDGDAAASVSERIKALVEAQIADVVMTSPRDEQLPRLPLQRLRVELEDAVLASGPADTTAFHDVHSLQLAYPNVWVEALNPELRLLIEAVYRSVNTVVRSSGLSPDDVLMDEIDDLDEFLDHVSGLADAVTEAHRSTLTDEVLFLWPDADGVWHLLDPGEAAALVVIATEKFPRFNRDTGEPWEEDADRVYDRSRSIEEVKRIIERLGPDPDHASEASHRDEIEIADREARGRIILDRAASRTEASDSDDSSEGERAEDVHSIGRLRRLLRGMAKMLGEPYAFEYFAPNSTNFGIVVTHRQRWRPGLYQVGDMVGTIPLAPGESRRLQVKETRATRRDVRELEKAMWTRAGESTQTRRATTEILRRAEASTNFAMTSRGSYNIGTIASIGGTTSFAHNQSLHSQTIKRDFREAVLKASHEYRNERSLDVSTSEEESIETTSTGELSNPNNELTVTYLLYELERQYQVSEQIHDLQPVILVAQRVPAPNEITEAWLLRHEWILRRVLLDDSLEGALDELHDAFAGEEVGIAIKQANWESQVRIVETLEGEHSQWLSLKRQLNKDLVNARYRERIAEAAEDAGGFLADIAEALVFDPGAAIEGGFEARRKMLEEQMEWVHDELQQSAEKLSAAREALDSATRGYSEALERRTQRRTQIDQLRIHVKDNVLYYMQAIWAHEPPDQRYFRLHNVPVLFPQASTTTCRVRTATPEEGGYLLPGIPDRNVIIDNCDTPTWDLSTSARRKLHEVADLDNPLGFKGNYMIFPLRECSLITDYMMWDYVDSYFGIRDPDELSEFTTDELLEYRRDLVEEEQEALDYIIAKRLSSPEVGESMVVIPTGHLYIEALLGGHTLLEPFKLAHRGYDAARAREELRRAGLENLRYAARLVEEAPLLEDPEVDRRVRISGDGDTDVDIDVP